MNPRPYYLLNKAGEPVNEPDVLTWARGLEKLDRTVAKDRIGAATVSTVFLGLDHNFIGTGPPVLWESMVFGSRLEGTCMRCAGSREQAIAMHGKILAIVKAGLSGGRHRKQKRQQQKSN